MDDLEAYDPTHCHHCGKSETSDAPLHECGTCAGVVYCSASCMKSDFDEHRNACNQRAATMLCHAMHHVDRHEVGRLARHKRVINTNIARYRPPSDSAEYNDWTPLHECVRLNDVETLDVLLKGGAKVNIVNSHQQTPLWLASSSLEVGITVMERLLNADGVDPNLPASDGSTPLVRATILGSCERVELLLRKGSNVDAGVDDSGRSVLTIAQANAASILPTVRLSHSSRSEVVVARSSSTRDQQGEIAGQGGDDESATNEAKRLLQLVEKYAYEQV